MSALRIVAFVQEDAAEIEFLDGEIERAIRKKLNPGWSGTYGKSAIRMYLLWSHAHPAPPKTPKRACSAQHAVLR
jgi:hypothetical protein